MSLFAATASIFENMHQALGRDGFIVMSVLSIIFTSLILIATIIIGCIFIKNKRESFLKHEERLAMIDAGINPDFPPENLEASTD